MARSANHTHFTRRALLRTLGALGLPFFSFSLKATQAGVLKVTFLDTHGAK